MSDESEGSNVPPIYSVCDYLCVIEQKDGNRYTKYRMTVHFFAAVPSSGCATFGFEHFFFCLHAVRSSPGMFRCGIAYPRCRWIVPLLVLFAVIFDLIAVAAKSGWVEDEDAKTHYANMWNEWRGRGGNWAENSLMDFTWAQAVAALMIIGLILLIIAFIVAVVAMCKVDTGFMVATAVLLAIVVLIQIIALIIYPVNFNERIFEGQYYYTWAYGFGWGATILSLGCSILFCCLPNYEDHLNGNEKIKYLYQSQ